MLDKEPSKHDLRDNLLLPHFQRTSSYSCSDIRFMLSRLHPPLLHQCRQMRRSQVVGPNVLIDLTELDVFVFVIDGKTDSTSQESCSLTSG